MNFNDMMEQLKTDYVQAIPQRIIEIQKHLDQQDPNLLREDFHKLKGTGKTYGLPEISVLAEVVERICMLRPDCLTQVVPVALEILSQIHDARSRKLGFAVDLDPRFEQMKRFAS